MAVVIHGAEKKRRTNDDFFLNLHILRNYNYFCLQNLHFRENPFTSQTNSERYCKVSASYTINMFLSQLCNNRMKKQDFLMWSLIVSVKK